MKNISRCLLAGLLFCLPLCFAAPDAAWGHPFYQLRDVSGQRDGHTVAGSQWFGTVEDLWWDGTQWLSHRDTHGAEAPGVTMVTSADLIENFNSVYLEDPQHDRTLGDDDDFDPIESLYLVIPEGQGKLKIDFGNDYATHSPYPWSGPQDVMEDILLSLNDYTTRVIPERAMRVASGDWLHAELTFQADASQSYGSSLGYLTFRQSASFDANASGFRESIKIPLVVANVFDGSAAESGNELNFDMTLLDGNELVTRKKFRWGADENVTQDFGTFFMILPKGSSMPQYQLETRITNRTGTRYRNQRYDYISSAYQEIWPQHWTYDLTRDLYGTLPASFQLDPQSQIAPGLSTLYKSTMDMAYSSSESFRLYPYQGSAAPRDLRLTFRKVGGMAPYGSVSSPAAAVPPWTVTAFDMTFADVIRNKENTVDEIAAYIGGNPVMPATGYAFSGVENRYIKADAYNSFMISADVPAGLVGSDDVALLPARVRIRVSRKEAPIVGIWSELDNSDNVIDTFAKTCTIWVRSDAAAERDMNLFTTLRNRGYGVDKCVRAFTHEDFLYLDFIVWLADAVSQNAGKTAFCQVVEDDKVPYILIGDGNVDDRWQLSFYVAETGENPTPDPTPDPVPSGGGGGGCNGGWGSAALLSTFCLAVAAKRR